MEGWMDGWTPDHRTESRCCIEWWLRPRPSLPPPSWLSPRPRPPIRAPSFQSDRSGPMRVRSRASARQRRATAPCSPCCAPGHRRKGSARGEVDSGIKIKNEDDFLIRRDLHSLHPSGDVGSGRPRHRLQLFPRACSACRQVPLIFLPWSCIEAEVR